MSKKSLKSGKFVYKAEIADMVIASIMIITIGGFLLLILSDRASKQDRLENQEQPGININDVLEGEKVLEETLETYQ